MSTTHKAILKPDGTFRELVPLETSTASEVTLPYIETPRPDDVLPSEVLVEGLEVTDTAVVQTWTKRPKTDAEAQTTFEQLTLIDQLSDEELIALEDICQPGHPYRATGLRIRNSMLAAIETYSRTVKTKTLIGAAIQLGVVSGVERARTILNDPGFTLE